MLRRVYIDGTAIEYEFLYKKVKNINLRIKTTGEICVSANRRVGYDVIDAFVISKSDFIFTALSRLKEISLAKQTQFFSDSEICNVITEICEKVYPYFDAKGIKYPQIKFRKMVSRWGSCNVAKNIITFNTNLIYAPLECIEYVVVHEFTHFLIPNHSHTFYSEVSALCPEWKMCRNKLKEIIIPHIS